MSGCAPSIAGGTDLRETKAAGRALDAGGDWALILTPAIYQKLESTGRGAGSEIQLTDGIAALLRDEKVYAYAFEGTRLDCGSKLGYLEATVEFGLKHPKLGKPFSEYVSEVAARKVCHGGDPLEIMVRVTRSLSLEYNQARMPQALVIIPPSTCESKAVPDDIRS